MPLAQFRIESVGIINCRHMVLALRAQPLKGALRVGFHLPVPDRTSTVANRQPFGTHPSFVRTLRDPHWL